MSRRTARTRLAVAAAAVALLTSGCWLSVLAASRGIVLGTAVRADALANDPSYGSMLAQEFSMVVPENELKWDTTEPQPGVFDFAAADRIAAFATAHHLTMRGTPLVWSQQNPAWLTSTTWTPATLGPVLDDHIATLVGHYAGTVKQWDVVNEAFADDGSLRSTVWSQTLGPGYIDRAFQDARAADPSAALFYNDYNIEWSNAKADAVFAMVSSMKQRGIPIDGVGFQMHATEGFPTGADLAAQFARYAAIGVSVAVTEMDVRIPVPPTAADLQAQAQTYHDAMAACVGASNCHTFLVWGFTDKYSWIPGFFPGTGAATLLDASLRAKPAYAGVWNALKGH